MINFVNKPNDEDLYNFFYLLQMYSEFGVRNAEAIAEFLKSVKKQSLREIMEGVLKDIRNGSALADAMQRHPSFFPPYTVEMIRVGEKTGQMNSILSNLVFSLENEMETEKDVRSALWTPKIFILALGLVFCIVVFFVIPKMGDILKELNTELPVITVMVVNFGNFMLNFWYLVLTAAILSYGAWDYFVKRRPERYDKLKLKMPFVKGITYTQMQFRFASIFGMCLMANIDSKTSLKYAANAASNIFMKRTLLSAIRKMEASGAPLVEALIKANVYNVIHPDFFTMIRAGSKGNLADVMIKLANRQQKELLRLSKQIGDKIGFAVIVPSCIFLIFLILSIEIPVFSIINDTSMSGGGM